LQAHFNVSRIRPGLRVPSFPALDHPLGKVDQVAHGAVQGVDCVVSTGLAVQTVGWVIVIVPLMSPTPPSETW
jgi:hypothetical protein